MSDADIRRALRAFILENFLPGEDPETLEDSTLLVSSGIVPSLALLELVTFIEDSYGVELEPDDLGVERMDSVDALVALVAERRPPDSQRVRG